MLSSHSEGAKPGRPGQGSRDEIQQRKRQQRGQGGAVGETAAARSRRGTAEFLPSFVALQRAVAEACSGQIEWQGKIAAAIGAALEFASKDPAAARVLTITARRERSSRGDREQEVIDYFSARLAELAPGRVRSAISTDAG